MKDKFINLVKNYGKNNVLYTFEYCSYYGIELQKSTIDQIEINELTGDVIFVYNANVIGDYSYIEHFKESDLETFYNELRSVL